MKKHNIYRAIVAAFLSAEISVSAMAHEAVTPEGMEKCYGIAKAGKNECGVKGGHMCATLSKQDKDPKSWIFLPKGTCEKIVGGAISTTDKDA